MTDCYDSQFSGCFQLTYLHCRIRILFSLAVLTEQQKGHLARKNLAKPGVKACFYVQFYVQL